MNLGLTTLLDGATTTELMLDTGVPAAVVIQLDPNDNPAPVDAGSDSTTTAQLRRSPTN